MNRDWLVARGLFIGFIFYALAISGVGYFDHPTSRASLTQHTRVRDMCSRHLDRRAQHLAALGVWRMRFAHSQLRLGGTRLLFNVSPAHAHATRCLGLTICRSLSLFLSLSL
jgi:hypothetical protein